MEEVKIWWKQAKRDLISAETNIKLHNYYLVSFMSHQAVEKALKALYIKEFKELIKIHNIVVLAQRLKLPQQLIDECDKLNPAYIESRYPDAAGILPAYSYKKKDAETDLESAQRVMKWIEKKL